MWFFPLIQFVALLIGLASAVALIAWFVRNPTRRRPAVLVSLVFIAGLIAFSGSRLFTGVLTYPFQLAHLGPGESPALPLTSVFRFFFHQGKFARIPDIARDPVDSGSLAKVSADGRVNLELTAKEVIAEMAPGVTMNYWTYDGTVPGPMLRVREGDTVELTLHNDPSSLHHHNIDLHAVTGPGGGATVTGVAPGESKTFTFKALNPGLYVYHCAHTNVAQHMAHGMYGLILVEPKEGLRPVDEEYYVMQGEFYTLSPMGSKGLQMFDAGKMLNGKPEYIVFNGRTGALTGKMKAKVGESVRIYVGNGGVNDISSFHVIGEIFDNVYPEGAIGSAPHQNIQSTMIPAGGSAIVEFNLEVPGRYVLVDHALARIDRGAWGILEVTGEKQPDIFDGQTDVRAKGH